MAGKPKKPDSLPVKAPEVITLDLDAIGELDEGQRLPPRPGDPPAPKRAPPPPTSTLPTLIGMPAIPAPPVVDPPREEPPAQVPQLVAMFPVEEPSAAPEPPRAPDAVPSEPKHKLARPLNPRAVRSDSQTDAASADLAPPPEWLPPPESVIPELNDPPFVKKEPSAAEPLGAAREKLDRLARIAKEKWRELANGPRPRFYIVLGVAAFVMLLLLGILIRLIV